MIFQLSLFNPSIRLRSLSFARQVRQGCDVKWILSPGFHPGLLKGQPLNRLGVNIKIDFLTVIDRPQRGRIVITHDEVVGKGRKHTTTTAWLNRLYQNIFNHVKTQNLASLQILY